MILSKHMRNPSFLIEKSDNLGFALYWRNHGLLPKAACRSKVVQKLQMFVSKLSPRKPKKCRFWRRQATSSIFCKLKLVRKGHGPSPWAQAWAGLPFLIAILIVQNLVMARDGAQPRIFRKTIWIYISILFYSSLINIIFNLI